MEQRYTSGGPAAVNVGTAERAVTAIAGSLLLYFTARKHRKESLLLLGGGYLLYRAVTGHCPLYGALQRGQSGDQGHARNVNVKASVIVGKPRDEVYSFWRRLENLPLFMKHLESVDEIDNTHSAWKVGIPGGFGEIRWEAIIVKDLAGVELSWHSVPGASIENAGKINFSDTPGKGTRIDALISYRAPMGVIGERVSRLLTPLFSDMIEKDILRFKHFMENMGTEGD